MVSYPIFVRRGFASLSFVALLLAATPAAAQNVKSLGSFGNWSAYTYQDERGAKVCFMSSKPTKSEGNYSKRDPVYATITHIPSDKATNTFSLRAGYTYKQASEVALTIDGSKFSLFTHGDTAWAPKQDVDNAIADSIKKGSRLVLKGTSARGTLTTDTFSLNGSGKAHAAISKECGV